MYRKADVYKVLLVAAVICVFVGVQLGAAWSGIQSSSALQSLVPLTGDRADTGTFVSLFLMALGIVLLGIQRILMRGMEQ